MLFLVSLTHPFLFLPTLQVGFVRFFCVACPSSSLLIINIINIIIINIVNIIINIILINLHNQSVNQHTFEFT